MLREQAVRATALVLLITTAFVAIAQTQGGMLTATAGVQVNGKPVAASVDTAVLSGDKIQTAEGTAQIRLDGTLIQLGKHSDLAIGAVPEFGCGQVAFFSVRGIPLRLGAAQVTPSANEETKYQIIRAAGTLAIYVTLGSVQFVNGSQTLPLRSGESTTVADAANCPAISTLAAAPPAAQTTVPKGKLLGLLIGGGAAGAVVGVIATRGKQPASPSRP